MIHDPRTLLFSTTDCHEQTEETFPLDLSSSLPKEDLNRIFLDASSQLQQFLTRRVQCPETAADLTQEVYLRLPQMQATVVSEVGVRAWLFRVASNLSIDHLRSQRRHAELLNQFCGNETEIDKAPSPYRSVMDRDRLKQVQDALKDLPDQCAEVLYLSRIEGFSHADIAKQLGISKSLVEKHVSRALNHCRQRGVAIFAKAFLGFPAQKSGKNYATAHACGCPSRPASLVAYYATSFSQ